MWVCNCFHNPVHRARWQAKMAAMELSCSLEYHNKLAAAVVYVSAVIRTTMLVWFCILTTCSLIFANRRNQRTWAIQKGEFATS